MNPQEIIKKYYHSYPDTHTILLKHSFAVMQKALIVAEHVKHLNPDFEFLKEAAQIHDIGMIRTHAPGIGCHGYEPYIKHGVLGGEILEKEGFPKHALVCERHTGVGISKEEIIKNNLPLPHRDLIPISIEEEIICFADKFFSKNKEYLTSEKPLSLIKDQLRKFGDDKVKKFEKWIELFTN